MNSIVFNYTRPLLSTSTVRSRSKEIESAMEHIQLPTNWQCMPAHHGTYTPSISMLTWAVPNKRHTRHPPTGSIDSVFDDKMALIEQLAELQKTGAFSVSDDKLIVAEGCDNGNYLPSAIAVLVPKGRSGSTRLFLTNGNSAMVKQATEVGYRALRALGIDEPQVYGGLCNAFDRYPSEIDVFPNSQKIFIPFRLGIVENYEAIRRFIEQRIPIMGRSGACGLCLLMDTDKTRAMLKKEHGKTLRLREGPGYVEGFRLLHPTLLQTITNGDFPKHTVEDMLRPLKSNFKGEEGKLYYPCITAFKEKKDIFQLIESAGGNPQEPAKPIRTRTDRGNLIDAFPTWITSK